MKLFYYHQITLLLIFVVYLNFSCHSDVEKDGINPTHTVLLDINNESSRLLESSDIVHLDIIVPTTDDEFILDNFDKILFRDRRIFIKPHNRGQLFVFSHEGEGLTIIDRLGAGPGEYLHLTDFDVDSVNQQIIILDAGNRKILHYSYAGELISEKSLDLYIKLLKAYYHNDAINYIVDLGASSLLPGQNTAYSINLFTHDWEFVRGYFEFSKPQVGMIGKASMLFNKSGKATGYYKPFTDAIYHFKGHRMVQAYRLKFPLPVLPYDIFEKDPYGNYSTDKYVYNIMYDENDAFLYLKYLQQDQSYFIMYNKIQNAIQHYRYPHIRGDCTMLIFQNILALHHSSLVIQIAPTELECVREFFGPVLSDSQIQILDQMEENDNNILLLVKLGGDYAIQSPK